jgi:hypothetical protein
VTDYDARQDPAEAGDVFPDASQAARLEDVDRQVDLRLADGELARRLDRIKRLAEQPAEPLLEGGIDQELPGPPRRLAEFWQREIRRHVGARGEARLREPLDRSLSAPILDALTVVFARTPGWVGADEGFRHEVDGGHLLYRTATRELEIVAVAGAEAVAEAEGVGQYYDDGWAGMTEHDARREAARLAAAEALEAARRAAEERLSAVGVQVQQVFGQVLAEAYREAILAYARNHQGRQAHLTEHDGVIDIEVELEA